MKKKILTTIFIALFFLAGLSLLLYPLVSNEWNSYRQSRLMAGYDEALIQQEEEGTIDYTELWEKAKAYNEALLPSVLRIPLQLPRRKERTVRHIGRTWTV